MCTSGCRPTLSQLHGEAVVDGLWDGVDRPRSAAQIIWVTPPQTCARHQVVWPRAARRQGALLALPVRGGGRTPSRRRRCCVVVTRRRGFDTACLCMTGGALVPSSVVTVRRAPITGWCILKVSKLAVSGLWLLEWLAFCG
jgi:hypothetical protein